VQSHWFAVGSVVTWARAGVGAVATQAIAEIAHGPRIVELLDSGLDAEQALAKSMAEDAAASTRQVGVIDRRGLAAAHTGSSCIPCAGQAVGDGVACQANMMASKDVWPAMLDAFSGAEGPLARRLLVALDAGEAAGGDIRGRQSAAMLVVPPAGEPWRTVVSLRVDDDPEPLVELRRLLGLHEAYEVAERADSLVGESRHGEAAVLYRRASELAPDSDELRFWAGLGMAQAGELHAGADLVRSVIEAKPAWGELLARLSPEIAPSAGEVRARLRDPATPPD
jgi:uncharacterized Ntn-hydrolase superfamily protein